MPKSVSDVDALMRLNTVQPHMAKAEITVNRVDGIDVRVDDAEILSLISTALRRADVKQEHAATLAKVKPSQCSSALNGHGGFNARWLWPLPSEFWNEFLPLLRANKESSAEARRAQRKERLIKAIEVLLTEVA